MKAALLIYGHMRSFKNCFHFLEKNLLSILKPDIFIHTWSTIESKTPSWHSSHIKKNTTITQEEVFNLYKPKSLKIETQQLPKESENKVIDGVNLFGFKCMYHSLSQSNQLRKIHEKTHDIKYDLIVKIRPDIILKRAFPVEKLYDVRDNEVILAGNKKNNHDFSPHGYLAVDIINGAKPRTMDYLCEINHYVDEYFGRSSKNKNGFLFHLEKKEINVVVLDFKYYKDWEILRR